MVRIQLPEYFVGKSLPVVAVLEEVTRALVLCMVFGRRRTGLRGR